MKTVIAQTVSMGVASRRALEVDRMESEACKAAEMTLRPRAGDSQAGAWFGCGGAVTYFPLPRSSGFLTETAPGYSVAVYRPSPMCEVWRGDMPTKPSTAAEAIAILRAALEKVGGK